jgi:glycosyltransferase involved in cell wall biosynthesis
VPSTINTIPGLGYLFLGKGLKGWLQRELAILAYRAALSPQAMRVIFQNPDDRDLLVGRRVLTAEKSRVVRGSGVNLDEFKPRTETEGSPIVLLASRLIWDKGLRELIEATRMLKARGIKFRTVLAGAPDINNPNAVPLSTLEDWKAEGIVECWGHRDDMAAVMNEASIVVLPSYREGVPRVLVEAAGCAKAIIATDVPGCREIVRHAENGLLVPPGNSRALAEAMEKLLNDPDLRRRMGLRGREIVVCEFSEEMIINQTLAVYQELLEERWVQVN